MLVDEEPLDTVGQLQALESIKGRLFPHGPKATREDVRDILVMRPRRFAVAEETVLTWSMGHRPGVRRRTRYNAETDTLDRSVNADDHTVFTDFIAVPRLGAMAIDDRVSEEYMGARSALSRLRSAFQNVDGGSFQGRLLAPGDVSAIVEQLDLKEYSYSVRRYNPHTRSALAKQFSEALESEGIFTNRGVAKPAPGSVMKSGEGIIGGTAGLADDGYGVVGFRGITPSGRTAHLPKPKFSTDKDENLREQAKEQRLRVFFEANDDDDLIASVVAELVRFYGDDGTPPIPEVPSGGLAA